MLNTSTSENLEKLSPFEQEFLESITDKETKAIFFDPYDLDCGHTFEKASLAKNDDSYSANFCPDCGKPITEMRPNVFAKRQTESFLNQHPSYVQRQFFSEDYVLELIKTKQIEKIKSIYDKHPKKINTPLSADGKTALHWAVMQENIPLLSALIEIAGIDIDSKAEKKRTPLIMAIMFDSSIEIIKLLFEKSKKKSLLLHYAAIGHTDPAVFKLLITEIKINEKKIMTMGKKRDNYSALHAAIAYNNEEAVKFLLENGVDINVETDESKKTPLDFLNKESKPEIVILLIRHAITTNDIPALNKVWGILKSAYYINARLLLHHAVFAKNAAAVKLLTLTRGEIDINEQDKHGRTPLHCAIACGNIEGVRTLIECGAQINIPDKKGNTALYQVLVPENVEKIIKLVLSRCQPRDLSAQTASGATILDVLKKASPATKINFLDCVMKRGWGYGDYTTFEASTLVKEMKVADPELIKARNEEGITLLHLAARHNWNALFYIKAGADINAKDNCGWTPLHYALFYSDYNHWEQNEINVEELSGSKLYAINIEDFMLFLYRYQQNIRTDTKIAKYLVHMWGDGKESLAHLILNACQQLYKTDQNLAFEILTCINDGKRENESFSFWGPATLLAQIFRTPTKGESFVVRSYDRTDKGTAAYEACEWYEKLMQPQPIKTGRSPIPAPGVKFFKESDQTNSSQDETSSSESDEYYEDAISLKSIKPPGKG